ncbi:MAG: 50S ribosomal protein L13 [Candidatus Marinimicrobia bacterium]|jgi:large subunit ribosomal protein L13|nr:50S ribosomal protein L13 [Candidatus Neomarinimicrobiota bacterium]MDP6852614.1 50S ribosomal protein L13 [Candidatus Neomarinimicrobiota bacterium]
METISVRAKDITRDWYIIDAEGKTLGRLASRIAQVIRGKQKTNFTPHMDMGDFVVVINAEKVKLTGNKEENKSYFRHSGYPGGVTQINLKKVREVHPERIIMNAVKGMLPHNRLGRKLLKHLKVYSGDIHPHAAQQPQTISI